MFVRRIGEVAGEGWAPGIIWLDIHRFGGTNSYRRSFWLLKRGADDICDMYCSVVSIVQEPHDTGTSTLCVYVG